MVKPVEILIKARDEASGILGGLQGKLTSIGLAIAGYFGISAFVGAVKGAADLEAKLSEVRAVSGATAAEMGLLRRAAEDAGATTKYTATEAADALGNLARAGLSAKDTIAALPAVLQLAQAGGIDLGRASEYVTKTIMGMGLAFTDAGRVADVLAMGANASNTSVEGLAQALSYAAPLAKTLGLSLETTVAIIGKFADAGIDASRAGTALNAIMAQFADPASKFRTELAGAGITTANFEQALRQLAAAGPAGSKAINAVGIEAGPALRALLNQGIGALDDLKGKLDKSSGSAAELARIMNDNLNGATAGLGSAWESVKNALATPVLPVLKDGIQQLSAAFTEAVSNGTIGRFGTTIATAFEGSIKWVKAFAAEVDFTALAARMQAFATDTQATFTKIGDAANNAGNIVKLVYGVMSAGANGVMTAIYSMGLAFSETGVAVVKVSLRMTEALQKIAIGDARKRLQDEAETMRVALAGLTGVSEAMAQKVNQSFISVGDSAQTARNGWDGLTNATQAASVQASATNPVIKSMADSLAGVGTAATDAAIKAKESANKQQAAAIATKERIAALHAEYEAAVDTGNWQLAAEKLQALDSAANTGKAATSDLKKQAEEDAAAVAASFERMGIKTKGELGTMANVAKQDFERIRDSGQATTDGLQTAYKKYAEAAIAANGGVATEAIKSEAAMRGLQVQTDAAGKAIVSSMGAGKSSTDQYTTSVHGATRALEDQNTVLAQRKAALDALNASTTPAAVKSQLTKDDMKGVDNTGLWSLQQKQQNGTLGKDDLATAEAALQAAAANLDVYQKNTAAFSLQGAASIQESYNAARMIAEMVRKMSNVNSPQQSQNSGTQTSTITNAQSGNQETFYKGSASASNPVNHTYSVAINSGGRTDVVNVSSDQDAKNLIAALQRAKLSA